MWFVTIILWLQAFAAPVFLFGLFGFVIGDIAVLYILLVIGAVAGIVVAEYIRSKIGLDIFFSRIYGPTSSLVHNRFWKMLQLPYRYQ